MLTESIEDAALTWFGELGYAVGQGPLMAPGEPAAEREAFGEVALVRRLRNAVRQISSLAHPTPLCDTLLPKLLSGQLKTTN